MKSAIKAGRSSCIVILFFCFLFFCLYPVFSSPLEGQGSQSENRDEKVNEGPLQTPSLPAEIEELKPVEPVRPAEPVRPVLRDKNNESSLEGQPGKDRARVIYDSSISNPAKSPEPSKSPEFEGYSPSLKPEGEKCRNVTVSSVEGKAGSLVKIGGKKLVIEKERNVDSVFVIGTELFVEGKVTGDIFSLGSKVEIGEGAVVEGRITVVGGEFEEKPGATVRGERVILSGAPGKFFSDFIVPATFFLGARGAFLATLVFFLSLSLAVLVLLFLFPPLFMRTGEELECRPLFSFFAGFIAFVAMVPVSILMVLTIVGIVAVPFYVAFMVFGMFTGWASALILLGRKLMQALASRPLHPILSFLLGLLVFLTVSSVPFLGSIFVFLLTVSGLGAFIISLRPPYPHYYAPPFFSPFPYHVPPSDRPHDYPRGGGKFDGGVNTPPHQAESTSDAPGPDKKEPDPSRSSF